MHEYFKTLFDAGYALNNENILDCFEHNPMAAFLDLGCDEGTWTMKLAKKIGTFDVTGVDVTEDRLKEAEEKGIKIFNADLNSRLPFSNDTFDVIHSNQVIEHIADLDVYLTEMYRVLKPGGYAVVSTENGSSWHNIFASIMGWQIFSLTNFSRNHRGVGNPMAAHRDRGDPCDKESWTHKTIFNYLGLKEFFEAVGFKKTKIFGAGYAPFPAKFGRLDPRHAHFITIKAYK